MGEGSRWLQAHELLAHTDESVGAQFGRKLRVTLFLNVVGATVLRSSSQGACSGVVKMICVHTELGI